MVVDSKKAYNLAKFLQLPADPTPFHCWPLLPRTGMMLVYGSTKQYKSFLTMNIGYELSEALPVLGVYDTLGGPKRVLLIEQECGQEEAQKRLKAIHEWRKGKTAGDNFWVVSKDLDCAIDSDSGMETITRHVDEAKPDVLILDPFSWFHSRPSNDNDEIKRVLKKLFRFQMERNIGVILNHHATKRSEFRDGDGSDLNSIKGATALPESASSVIGVSQPTSDKTMKQLNFTFRHGKEPAPLKIRFIEDSGTFEHV